MEDYKKKTIESYDNRFMLYEKKFKDLFQLYEREEFNKFIKLLSGKKVLDVGCGPGDHSLYFKQQGLDVTCIDLSKEMIGLCKEKGLNASIMDMETLEFPDASSDGVWAVTSLLHIPKKKISSVLSDINRIMKNKGILYVCLKKGHGEVVKKEDGFERFFAYWQMDELLKVLEKQFEIIESEEIESHGTVFLQVFCRKTSSSR